MPRISCLAGARRFLFIRWNVPSKFMMIFENLPATVYFERQLHTTEPFSLLDVHKNNNSAKKEDFNFKTKAESQATTDKKRK